VPVDGQDRQETAAPAAAPPPLDQRWVVNEQALQMFATSPKWNPYDVPSLAL